MADQLQTNYASDLRHMLKSVFDSYTSEVATRLDATDDSGSDSLDMLTDSHLSNRTVTSANRVSSNNNHRSATSMLGVLLIPSLDVVTCLGLLFIMLLAKHIAICCYRKFCIIMMARPPYFCKQCCYDQFYLSNI